MKKSIFAILAFCASASGFAADGGDTRELSAADILATLEKTAQWHVANPTNTRLNIRDWEIGPYYDGLIALSKQSGNPAYWAEVIRLGDSAGWSPFDRKYHADDHAVAHAWLDTYSADPVPAKAYRIAQTKKMLDEVIEDAKTWGDKKPFTRFGGAPVNAYNWCDALYMSPPTFARMYAITGDKKYLDYLHREYKNCRDTLFSEEDDLFYRDGSYIGKKTKNGKRVFWGRGNGWVMASFAQVLPYLPKDDPSRKYYEDLFKRMADKLLKLQLDDGMWGVSLIDPDEFGGGETSSTCFIAYGMAWGVRSGILDKAKFMPALEKAWKRLVEKCVTDEGKLVYVQPVGEAPNKFNETTSNPYGVGAFAMFGCEMAKILGHNPGISETELVRRAEALNDAATPRAVAILEPRRADDIAWENDKVAFRAYGPALKDSIENSGIDVWFKRVSYPILKRTYARFAEKNIDYHKDNGEGYDNFKVADTVGCGGSGIWVDGKLVKSNVYKRALIHWTSPDFAQFTLVYEYDINGKKIFEDKTITIRRGDNFCTVESKFREGRKSIAGLEVAFGLTPQTKDCKVVCDTVSRDIVTSETVDSKELKMFVRLCKDCEFVGFKKASTPAGNEELIVAKTGKDGKIKYAFGFDWK